jgi:hypothetical protein
MEGAAKEGGIHSGWCIYGGTHRHSDTKKRTLKGWLLVGWQYCSYRIAFNFG